jgi:hypothetical protein
MVIALLLLLAGAPQTCTTIQPGTDWVCINGGWRPPAASAPIPPLPVPANDIRVDPVPSVTDMEPKELRTVAFTLTGPGTCNRQAVTKVWGNPFGVPLKIKIGRAWLGTNHDAQADVRVIWWTSLPNSAASQVGQVWSWERYWITSETKPDTLLLGESYLLLPAYGWLTVEFFCSYLFVPTSYHAQLILYFER